MLFAHSVTNPACWRIFFSRSVSELSSDTIRIRAPSGIFNGEPGRVLLSPVLSPFLVIRLIARLLHFYVSKFSSAIGFENQANDSRKHINRLRTHPTYRENVGNLPRFRWFASLTPISVMRLCSVLVKESSRGLCSKQQHTYKERRAQIRTRVLGHG